MNIGCVRHVEKLKLLQLRVLGFGFLQDGNIQVGVFPEREEISVGGEGASAGGITISCRALLRLNGRDSRPSTSLQGVGTGYSQMRQRSRPAVPDEPVVVDDFLKLVQRQLVEIEQLLDSVDSRKAR